MGSDSTNQGKIGCHCFIQSWCNVRILSEIARFINADLFSVVVASICRLLVLEAFVKSVDFTSREGAFGLWCVVELDVAIICACLPQVRTLLARIFPELLQSQTYRISRNRKRAHGGSTDGAKILAPGEESARTRASSNEDVIINLTESQSTVPRTSEHRLDYDGLYV